MNAVEKYRQAVFRMCECVSPYATTEQFHDAVNEVLRTRKALGDVDLKDLNINWNKLEYGDSDEHN